MLGIVRETIWWSLRHRRWRDLWLATLVQHIGTWLQIVVVVWLMTVSSSSSFLVAMIYVIANTSTIALAFPAGMLADRGYRRTIIVGCLVIQAGAGVGLVVLLLHGLVAPWILLFFVLVVSAASAVSSPSWHASLPSLVPAEEASSAVALNTAAFQLARAIGPAIAGTLLDHAGAPPLIVCYCIAALVLAIVVGRTLGANTDRHPRKQQPLPEGKVYGAFDTFRDPQLQNALICLFMLTSTTGAFFALLPVLVGHAWQGGPTLYGGLLSTYGLGAIAGITIMTPLTKFVPQRLLIGASAFLFGLALILMDQSTDHRFVLGLATVIGACATGAITLINVAVQAASADKVRARTMSTYLIVFFSGNAIGGLLWGAWASISGVAGTLTATAVFLWTVLAATRIIGRRRSRSLLPLP